MATDRRPAEVFPPGDFLREELQERGWTQDDLAAIMDKPRITVNQIIVGKRAVTPDTARGLASALGTSAQFWLNLESAYQLWRAPADQSDAVARRAHLFTIAPIKEMVRRGWIVESDSVEVLESQVMSFFQMTDLAKTPPFAHAARKSKPYDRATPAQKAWLFRSRDLSQYVQAGSYSRRSLNRGLKRLKLLMASPQEIRHVPRILGEAGIKIVIVERLPGTKMDGATFWPSRSSPVIAISTRYDRIDNFWFTLLHELGHVAARDHSMDVEIDAVREDSALPDRELRANTFAAEQAVPQEALDGLIARKSPVFSTRDIQGFAHRYGVHPGIVVGQLHHRNEVTWANFRRLLVPIREYITQSAATDGWGTTYPGLETG